MMTSFEISHIVLQSMVFVLSLCSGIEQVIVSSSSSCHKGLPLGILSLSILSHALNVLILRFTDLRSDLHYVVLGWSVLSGSLQVVALGLMTRKKRTSSLVETNITLTEVLFPSTVLNNVIIVLITLCKYFVIDNFSDYIEL